jgi:hypothetical protein
VLVGFFDESGLDEKSASFWVAGFVAHMGDWFEFSRAWKGALDEHGVAMLHTTDLANGRKAFDGWALERKTALLADLISIINSSNVLGFGAGVVKADYQRLIVSSGFLEEVGLKAEWWQEPYLLAFQQCVVEAVLKAVGLPASERINFIFDHQGTYASRCKMVFTDMSDPRVWPRGDRLGSAEFLPKLEHTPLQAADLLVYELRKRLDHRLTEPERAVRRSMERLSSRLISSRYVGEKEMRLFMEEVRPARTAKVETT